MGTPGERRARWWGSSGVAIAAIATLAILFFASRNAPLFSDYVEWTYHGVLLRDWMQGHPDGAYFLKSYPVPNSLTTVGLGVLMLAMSWKAAAKLWLLIDVCVGLWCASRLQRAAGTRQGWQNVVITAGALVGIDLWCGFTNFQFGTYFAMLFCALLMEPRRREWVYGLLLILLFFTHMIPFGFAVCVLCLYAWQRNRWRLLWQTAPSLLLCLWYFLGKLAHGNMDSAAGMRSSVPYASPAFVAFRVNTYLKCWGFVNVTSTFNDSILLKIAGPAVFAFLFAMDVAIGAIVLALAVRAARQGLGRQSPRRFFWITTVLFFAVGLAMPGAAAGISDPGGRMLQLAVWCAVCMVTTRGAWAGRVLSGCAVVLIGASLYQVAAVGLRPPMRGTVAGPLPGIVRRFGHVLYIDRAGDYDNISQGRMDADIYPTAMFLKRSTRPAD